MEDYKNRILLAIPAYNEAEVLESSIKEMQEEGYFNLLVVNDGSTDSTSEILHNMNIPEIKFVLNRGTGAATRASIYYALENNVDYLVLIDADGQHLPSDIKILFQCMQDNQCDVVIGNRFHENSDKIPWTRKFYNQIANIITRIGNTKVNDSQSGFRLLNKKAIQMLELEIDDFGVCTEMIWKCKSQNLTIAEAPISVRYTAYSMSKGQNFFQGIKTAFSLFKKL